jgi:hypothetical protein
VGASIANAGPDVVTDARLQAQVEKVLKSETFRGSEVLKRLLKFLAEKSSSGEADQVKEYTVAVEALDKPTTYDPRRDSAVRIQVGRLRQKLSEYYIGEGKDDEAIIDVPKGRFVLTCQIRSTPVVDQVEPPPKARIEPFLLRMAIAMWVALVIAIGWGEYSSLKSRKANAETASTSNWSPDLEALWHPILSSNRPLLLSVEDPLFVKIDRREGLYYRDKSLNTVEELTNSPEFVAVRAALKNPTIQPDRHYTAQGELTAAFLLGKLLGQRQSNFSLVRTSRLSWEQVADNNVIYVGTGIRYPFFGSKLQSLPIRPQLVPMAGGIVNLQPHPGEPAVFTDDNHSHEDEGQVYALISHLPGPVGRTDVESFTSNRAAGYLGAVQWMTSPDLAKLVAGSLRNASGQVPQYYQVLLKIGFKEDVPTEASVVLARELR